MSFEPQKFFVGLVDFFSILLPGLALAYLTKHEVALLSGRSGFPLADTESVLVLLFVAYLAGHVLFLLGSFLDDLVYDSWRKLTLLGQLNRLASGKALAARWRRKLAASAVLFGRSPDAALQRAIVFRARALGAIGADGSINTFKWCKSVLLKTFPEGALEVQRFEAASKFFRSFVPMLMVLGGVYLVRGALVSAAACTVGLVLVTLRYIDQRFKATEQAYIHVLALGSLEGKAHQRTWRDDGLTHAGGMVFRRSEAGIQWLLVSGLGKPDEWVLPKGHIDPGEGPRGAAVREVHEEAGVLARVVDWIETCRLPDVAGRPLVAWYLMEFAEEEGPAPHPEQRKLRWLTLEEAVAAATFVESKQLLDKAARSCAQVSAR